MAPTTNRSHNILAELADFAAGVSPDVPYEDLEAALLAAGWRRPVVRQTNIHECAGGVLVTFAILMSKADSQTFEALDEVSFLMPAKAGPISVGAQMQLRETIVFKIFGRLPPVPVAPEVPAPLAAQQNGPSPEPDTDTDRPVYEPNGSDDWTAGVAEKAVPNLIAKRTPDGLPIFVDLDDVKAPSVDIVEAVIEEMRAALPLVTEVSGLSALWSNNADAMGFVTQMGTVEQRAMLKDMMARRKGLIEGGFAPVDAPRRRGAATN